MSANLHALAGALKPSGSMWDGRLTRRGFLGWSLAATAGIAASHFFLVPGPRGRVALTWLSPGGSSAGMDDYPLWVALDRGYLDRLGIDLAMSVAGATPAAGSPSGRSITFPSPAELASAADRGLSTISIFNLAAGSVFGFAFRKGGSVSRARDLGGASIAVGHETWGQIVDPLLVEAGVDNAGARLVIAGEHWLDVLRAGEADAALSWRGLENTASGRGLSHHVGDRWSQLPSNSLAVDSMARMSATEVGGLERLLQATVMGLEFTQANPRAAAQITYRSAPGLRSRMSPQEAVDALAVTSSIFAAGRRRGLAWGEHDERRWSRYLDAAQRAGLVKSAGAADVYTNRFVASANSIDPTVMRLDAATFPLDGDFRHTSIPAGGLVDG